MSRSVEFLSSLNTQETVSKFRNWLNSLLKGNREKKATSTEVASPPNPSTESEAASLQNEIKQIVSSALEKNKDTGTLTTTMTLEEILMNTLGTKTLTYDQQRLIRKELREQTRHIPLPSEITETVYSHIESILANYRANPNTDKKYVLFSSLVHELLKKLETDSNATDKFYVSQLEEVIFKRLTEDEIREFNERALMLSKIIDQKKQ